MVAQLRPRREVDSTTIDGIAVAKTLDSRIKKKPITKFHLYFLKYLSSVLNAFKRL